MGMREYILFFSELVKLQISMKECLFMCVCFLEWAFLAAWPVSEEIVISLRLEPLALCVCVCVCVCVVYRLQRAFLLEVGKVFRW